MYLCAILLAVQDRHEEALAAIRERDGVEVVTRAEVLRVEERAVIVRVNDCVPRFVRTK